jgi:osmotically-inducible protein OsmY
MTDTTETTTAAKKVKSKHYGFFTATPLEFTLEGKTFRYAGRGRWSVELAKVVATTGKAPAKNKEGVWEWREATAQEAASAKSLTDKIAARLQAKADAAAARVAGKTTKKGSAPVAEEAPAETPVEA